MAALHWLRATILVVALTFTILLPVVALPHHLFVRHKRLLLRMGFGPH